MEIVLIRHGKPTGSTNPKLTAREFASWVRNYNRSHVGADSRPPAGLRSLLSEYYVVSSSLQRAIHSAELCLDKAPDAILKEVCEMDIPRHKLPFTFRAQHWLLMNRFLWLLGFNAKVESFKEAKERAKVAALELVEMAQKHEQVAVFGHGLMNRFIAQEIEQFGWICTEKNSDYWGTIKLIAN